MTTIPTQSAMELLEESIFYGLLSTSLFNRVNFVLERKFNMTAEAQRDMIWMTPRNGGSGCGGFVEMPSIKVDKPNSQVNRLLASVVFFEERNVNMTPGTGTLKSSEDWATLALEFLRGWILGQAGGLVPEPSAIDPAHDWMALYPQIICYRASVSQRLSRTIVARCDMPAIAVDGGLNITLTNGANTPDADIYWTVDGTFPCLATQANLYAGPFQVDSGAVVQWAAFQDPIFPSNTQSKVVT